MAPRALTFGLAGLMVLFIAVKPTHREPLLPVGSVAPVIHATTLDGTEVSVDFKNERTVLCVFDPSDGIAMLNRQQLDELFRAKGAEHRFIGLSLMRRDIDLIAGRADGMPIYIASGKTVEDYGAMRTMTMVVAPGGVVEHKWVGDLQQSQPDIERVFQMKFSRSR